MKIPLRYLPKNLTKKDKIKQLAMILKSKKMYKNNKYYIRNKVPSYKNKVSKHILNARKIYDIEHILPNKELSLKSGCNISSLKKLFKKGKVLIIHLDQDPTKLLHHGD